MEETAFREKVRKQLWFLNRKEKQLLEHTFEQNNASFNNAEQKFMKPTRFANQFFKWIFFLINYIICSHIHSIARMVFSWIYRKFSSSQSVYKS